MTEKPDLDSPQQIHRFVAAFYEKLLHDEQLAPIFLDVAAIDLEHHLPLIRSYWEKLLLGKGDYRRHTMSIHRALHAKRPLTAADFQRWLGYFRETVDALCAGPKAQRAKELATHIANNMYTALNEREN
jgi:hemoglobin